MYGYGDVGLFRWVAWVGGGAGGCCNVVSCVFWCVVRWGFEYECHGVTGSIGDHGF